ncbi:hypothetical protein GS597_14950 [Synechococcales cyanobacterium C]|uniref:Uncharacterized protein n=1 Tax=Petrachloros mirabilis ULC683 TaxID=2781853 RepID=A0A8K1ZZ15_9CYAN|nr:hypothetical protein [Petrachloros mirabilis]NCJ07784.1 hypothetical protein [Petrachloros mirabilis ULC683]
MTPKSGVLLAVSCVAAIAAIGSIFELSSGVPQLGQWTTAIILGLSVPVSIASFIAAARDAKASQ